MCTLLRTKVFPHAIFSDDEFEPHRAPSRPSSRASSRAPSRLGSIVPENRTLSRTRSLSAALDAEQRSLRRSASISANVGKRPLVREVSMSRTLRAHTPKVDVAITAHSQAAEKSRPVRDGVMLVESTPVKREKNRTDLPSRRSSGHDIFGSLSSGLLVESTPTKAKNK
jgi:hypothetical protein